MLSKRFLKYQKTASVINNRHEPITKEYKMRTDSVQRVVDLGLGQRVADMREKKGWSQVAFARYLNIDPTALSRFEAGRIKDPRLSLVLDMADAFGVTADRLLGRKVDRSKMASKEKMRENRHSM